MIISERVVEARPPMVEAGWKEKDFMVSPWWRWRDMKTEAKSSMKERIKNTLSDQS